MRQGEEDMRRWLLAAGSVATAGLAQGPTTPVIRVIGHGLVRTPPDVATISFTVRGEGASSDLAVRALTTRRDAVEAALVGGAQVTTGRLSVQEVRDKSCDAGDEDDKPRLSTGPCAVKGYLAALRFSARVTAVKEAGTLLGQAARLGATDPVLEDFALLRPAAARQAAVTEAIRDAREQAVAIAAASHVTLGPLRRVEDQRAGEAAGMDIIVTGNRAPPPEVTPPIVVKLSPEPIETRADLVVEFAIDSG